MKRILMASAAVPVAAIPEAFEPHGWYGEMDAGWHVLADPTPCQPFNAHDIDHEALMRACVAQYGIPAAMFDQCTNQKTNTVAASEEGLAFWADVLGQPYDLRDGL